MSNRIDQKVGNYVLTDLLGGGDDSEVYLASHLYLRNAQATAIKIAREQYSDIATSKFLNSADILKALDHKHIIPIFDAGIEQQTPYIVMAYAQHGSLHHVHSHGQVLSPQQMFTYAQQIVSGLAHIHEHQLVHANLKPTNILFDDLDHIWLSDIGIMAASTSASSSAMYMAPEQFHQEATPASDQYALAIILYEYLCGHYPFNSSHVAQMKWQDMHEAVPSLRVHNVQVSAEIDRVITKALSKDPQQRYSHILEFMQALEQAINGTPPLTSFQTAGPTTQGPRFFRQQQLQVQRGDEATSENSSQTKTRQKPNIPLVRLRLSYATASHLLVYAMALYMYLPSPWIMIGGIITALGSSYLVAASVEKDKLFMDQRAVMVSVLLLAPIAWGYCGWLSTSSLSQIITFPWLPHILTILGGFTGFMGVLIFFAFLSLDTELPNTVSTNSKLGFTCSLHTLIYTLILLIAIPSSWIIFVGIVVGLFIIPIINSTLRRPPRGNLLLQALFFIVAPLAWGYLGWILAPIFSQITTMAITPAMFGLTIAIITFISYISLYIGATSVANARKS